ncbi:MAG: GAF domain-containing protein [Betaproteobacteria bacterium]|nr:MAG: GAF domain-containing protein [Betaproteobacteria bacterium]
METVEDLFRRLEQLNEIGAALSQEKDTGHLLEKILVAAKAITRADGGTLYVLESSDEGPRLRFAIMRTDSLGIAMGGTTGSDIPYYPIHLSGKDGKPNNQMVAAYAALTDKTVNIADAYSEEGFDFSGTRNFDKKTGYRSKAFLTVPMKNHMSEIIGVLQLINSKDPATGEFGPFSHSDQRLAESLASQAAIALTNRQLIDQLERLFKSFIALINTAIDEKSHYTSGHCKRVPELTMMLAEAVNETSDGPLRNFNMSDKDRYELEIAGLLHDCGKVTTPVHVVDKATKLQTIFDRINLLDTLESDREFLRHCNVGREFMPPETQERVKQIGTGYQWTDVSGGTADFLTQDEIKNLTISKGTLTHEERETINHHIVATIKMLEALPWPKHLENVPEYAGGHHERMDGKGYPKHLTREQMSVQARVMGIADIFEALTAKDRPYKRGKTLTESLNILGHMKLDGHIDPDLFDIFVRKKVYLRYAEQFLDPDQIDEIDESKIPGFAADPA